MAILIRSFESSDVDQIVEFSVRAWEPVFKRLEPAVLQYVYKAFYPKGWRMRQVAEIKSLLLSEPQNVFVADYDGQVVGFVGIRFHWEDTMGEIYIIAVDPGSQRRGCAKALMNFAMNKMREEGMTIAMVETGDDPGHEPARASYERAGFERWPVARYFRKL